MNRIERLSENAVVETIAKAERLLRERKTTSQTVGTFSVKSGVSNVVSFTHVLDIQSPQSPSTGMAFRNINVRITTPGVVNYSRLVARILVDGVWYRVSDRLAAIKAGQPYYTLLFYERNLALPDAARREYQAVITGPINSTVVLQISLLVAGAQNQ